MKLLVFLLVYLREIPYSLDSSPGYLGDGELRNLCSETVVRNLYLAWWIPQANVLASFFPRAQIVTIGGIPGAVGSTLPSQTKRPSTSV